MNTKRRYKIYINEGVLLLCHKEEIKTLDLSESDNHLVMHYRNNVKLFHQCIDNLEKGGMDLIVMVCNDPKKAFKAFKSLYEVIIAGGGLVRNVKGEILIIFRRGLHDLPKGKQEKDESKKECARREVIEETGLGQVTVGDKLLNTYHTYKLKNGKRILKKCVWYNMTSTSKKIIVQTEEDIKWGKWMSARECLELDPIFASVKEVLRVETMNKTSI